MPTRPDAANGDPGAPPGVDGWVENHDDRWSFTLVYVGLALGLSTAISLFWLVAVVAAHGALEAVALRRRGVRDHLLGRVAWHLRLDGVLVLFALALGLYFDVIFGVVGLAPAARGGMQLTARVVAWQRAIRGVALAADDVALVARAAAARLRGSAPTAAQGNATTEPAVEAPPWRTPWTCGDRLTLGAGVVLALAVVSAPLWTAHDVVGALSVLAQELHPWPGR